MVCCTRAGSPIHGRPQNKVEQQKAPPQQLAGMIAFAPSARSIAASSLQHELGREVGACAADDGNEAR